MNEWVKVLLPIVAGLAITVIGYFLAAILYTD